MTTEFSKAWNNAELVKDTKIVFITPEIALELLQKNTNNRNFKKANLAFVKNELTKDRWQTTHQPIGIDTNGQLIDGQHRLEAIAKTKKSAWVRVTINCDPKTMNAVDTGRSRNNADMLQIGGLEGSKSIAPVMRQYINYYRHSNVSWTGPEAIVTSIDITDELKKIEVDVLSIFSYAKKLNTKFSFLPYTPAATFMLLCEAKDIFAPEYTEFFDQLVFGAGLPADSPVLTLRNRWLNAHHKMYSHSEGARLKLAELICVFNAFRANCPISARKLNSISIRPMPLLQ